MPRITTYKWLDNGIPWRVVIHEDGGRLVFCRDRLMCGSELAQHGGRQYVDNKIAELDAAAESESVNRADLTENG